MSRKIVTIWTAVLLVFSCSFSVGAEAFDPDKTGSISVTLTGQYQKDPMVGAQLSVYPVATVGLVGDGTLRYVYTQAFASCGIALDDPALATKLDAYLSQNDLPALEMTTNARGTAVCEDLPLGLYFVKQTGTVEGFAPCTPFLVTVPGESADGYVYDVDATPKTEVEKLVSITLKKVWNIDDSADRADSVTVQLLRDGNVIQTAVLNAQNHWQVTYTDMPESDAYSIKEVNVPKGFTVSYKQSGYVYTVTNSSTLVQTGQLLWPILVLAVSGMLLIGAGVLLLKKRKQNA